MKKLLIAGGSGLVGAAIKDAFLAANWEVLTLSRRPGPGQIVWDGKTIGPWQCELLSTDCVINLSGRSISTRFTPGNLNEILTSRVTTTNLIGEAIRINNPKCHWINASAIGFYGDRGDEVLTEASAVGSNVLAGICQQWEDAVTIFADLETTRVRVGIVLDQRGGALKPLLQLSKLGLGGHAGSGRQYMSWIHRDDLARLFLWLAEGRRTGVYNGTAPNPVTNKDFMATLRTEVALKPFKKLYRTLALPVPVLALNLVGKLIGPDSKLILNSQRVLPKIAPDEGFDFRYSEVEFALRGLLGKSN